MSTRRPKLDLYPGDLRRDVALQSCSIGARGTWYELLWVMHDGEPYGHLAVEGRPLGDEEAARLIGVPIREYRKYAAELLAAGVPGVREDGCWFNRRMVRDEEVRRARASGGHLGGNPKLMGDRKPAPEVGGKVEAKDNLPHTSKVDAEVEGISRAPARAQPPPRSEHEKSSPPEGVQGVALSPAVEAAIGPYLKPHRFPARVRAAVAELLSPDAKPSFPETLVVRALQQMQEKGRDFSGPTLVRWCANLARDEAAGNGAANGNKLANVRRG